MRLGIRGWALAAALALLACQGRGVSPIIERSSGGAEVIARATGAAMPLGQVWVTATMENGSADGPAAPLTSQPDGTWSADLSRLKPGQNQTFTVCAFDGSVPAGTPWGDPLLNCDTSNPSNLPAHLLYKGTATGVNILPGLVALVTIDLQQVHPPPPHTNNPPVLDSISVDSNQPNPGETVGIAFNAHDVDGHEALTYAWTATFANGTTAGSFDTASGAMTDSGDGTHFTGSVHYTAPPTRGIVTLTLHVTDDEGATASQSFTLMIGVSGSAHVSVTFNDWPVINGISVSTSPIQAGGTTAVNVAAIDPNGDPLAYAWASSCDGSGSGTFSDVSYQPVFTLGGSSVGTTRCTLTVTVTDLSSSGGPRGGSATATIVLPVGDGAPVSFGGTSPVLISLSQSTSSVGVGDSATLTVKASTGDGSDVSFYWTANVGAFQSSGAASQTTPDAQSSTVTWTATSCVAPDANGGVPPTVIAVTVTDPTTQAYFTVAFPMNGPGQCMGAAGTNVDGQPTDTAPVSTSGATLASPSTGVSLSIPGEALTTSTPITVSTVTTSAPPPAPNAQPTSPVYAFGPSGTVFAHPVTVKLPLPINPSTGLPITAGTVYWQQHDANGNPTSTYAPIGGTIQGNFIVAQVSHFSDAYIGPPSDVRTVSGSDLVTYQAANRAPFNVVPADATSTNPAVLVWSDGGYVEIDSDAGIGTDGTFAVENVPLGEYMLRVGSTYVVTSNDTLDLGQNLNGRDTGTSLPANDAGVGLVTLDVHHASPYQTSADPAYDGGSGTGADLFELVSSESETCWFDFFGVTGWSNIYNPEPPVGATDFAVTLDFSQYPCDPMNWMFEGKSRGETATIGQAVDRSYTDPASGTTVDVREMKRIATVTGFDMADGQQTVDVQLQDLGFQQSVNYQVALSQFAQNLVTGTPNAGDSFFDTTRTGGMQPRASIAPGFPAWVQWNGGYVDVEANGGGGQHGQTGATLDLAFVALPWNQITDFATGPMSFGIPAATDPTLPGWGVFTGAGVNFSVGYRLPCSGQANCPGSGYTRPGNGGWVTLNAWSQLDLASQPTGRIVPAVSPVVAAQIDGQPLSQQNTLQDTTPTVSWTAPAVGTPDEYTVVVRQLTTFVAVDSLLHTRAKKVATISTPHTSVVLPAGILQPGQRYAFVITAHQTGIANPGQAPNRQGINNAGASIASEIQSISSGAGSSGGGAGGTASDAGVAVDGGI